MFRRNKPIIAGTTGGAVATPTLAYFGYGISSVGTLLKMSLIGGAAGFLLGLMLVMYRRRRNASWVEVSLDNDGYGNFSNHSSPSNSPPSTSSYRRQPGFGNSNRATSSS